PMPALLDLARDPVTRCTRCRAIHAVRDVHVPSSTVFVVFRGRWLAGHVVAFVFLAGFVALGFWQLARDHQKHDKVVATRAKYAAPAPDLGAAAVTPPAGSRAQVTGTYDG